MCGPQGRRSWLALRGSCVGTDSDVAAQDEAAAQDEVVLASALSHSAAQNRSRVPK